MEESSEQQQPGQTNHGTILSINDDILVYIFKIIAPTESRVQVVQQLDANTNSKCDYQIALLKLLLVCRRFYDLIHLTPYFWTYISSRMSLTTIRRRVELSKAALLTINFNTPRQISQTFREEVFKEIEHTIPRWHTIAIPNLDQWDHFFRSRPSFVSLRKLDAASLDQNTSMFWDCSFPRLERLVFRSYNFFPVHTTFPSLQSCDITAYTRTMQPLRDFLSSISSIKELRIVLSSTTDVVFSEESRNLGRLCLPQLEKLTLADGRGESYRLLSILSLPKTRKLFLSNVAGSRTLSYIEDMIKNNYTYPINNLEFGARCPRGQHFSTILALFPSMHTLEFNVGGDLGKFRPNWSDINKGHCPGLRLLRIKHRLQDTDKLKLTELLQDVRLDGVVLEVSESPSR